MTVEFVATTLQHIIILFFLSIYQFEPNKEMNEKMAKYHRIKRMIVVKQ